MHKPTKKQSKRNTDITRTDVVIGAICGLFFLSVGIALLLHYVYPVYEDWRKFRVLEENAVALSERLNEAEGAGTWEVTQSCQRASVPFGGGDIYCGVSVEQTRLSSQPNNDVRQKISIMENAVQNSGLFEKINDNSPYNDLIGKEATALNEVKEGGSSYKPLGTEVVCRTYYKLVRSSLESSFYCRDGALSEHFPRSDI